MLKRGKRKSKYARRKRDFIYMGWVKLQPCCVAEELNSFQFCRGVIEADHMGQRAYGRKAPDQTCAPLCQLHHIHRHERLGYFHSLSKMDMRDWCDKMVSKYRAKYLESQGRY